MPFRLISAMLLCGSLVACGDGGSGPNVDEEASRMAAAFDALADSIEADGHEPTAAALRHAADLVRLTGGASLVTLTVDGSARQFYAIAEQLDFPIVVCAASPDSGAAGEGPRAVPGECAESGTHSMRTLIAWEWDRMAEVVRIVADTGTTPSQADVPDVMTGLPVYGGADSAVSGSPVTHPGFSGEYMVRDVGSWWARDGTQANSIVEEGGACTESRVTFGWAELGCEAALFRFAFDMDVEPAYWEYRATGERNPSAASGQHRLELVSSEILGVRLRVVGWTPPEPEPLPPPPAVDTATTLLLDASLDANLEGGEVVLRVRIVNPTDEPITFTFASGQQYDFTATAASGEVLWRWSADKLFTGAVVNLTLAPGEALEYEERWVPQDARGTVYLTAEFTSTNLPLARRAELEL